jgi:hypothetical protein
VSRFSGSEPSPSDSPVCTKHPRQSPLCMRTTPQQCGHSSSSCGVTERESVRLLRSIFYHPSWALVADCARFVHYRKAMHLPETASQVVIGWVPSRNRQPCESVETEKLTCEVERYTMHKQFYGKCREKFQKNAQKKKTGFYADVLATIWSGWRFVKPKCTAHLKF